MTKLLVPLDIETTGLDHKDDHILEISWAVTDEQFNVLTPKRTHILEHTNWTDVFTAISANEFIWNMHKESGLLADLRAKVAWSSSAIALQLVDDVNRAKQLLPYSTIEELDVPTTVHLTGFSVGFDRAFLQEDRELGLFFDRGAVLGFEFHHRLFDLSSIKMLYEAAGIDKPVVDNPGAHRAINDVQEVIDFGKHVVNDFALSMGGHV